MRRRPLFLLIPFLLAVAMPGFGAQGGTEPLACVDKSVTASAVRNIGGRSGVRSVRLRVRPGNGLRGGRRAFHEDERWRSGPTYVFVDEVVAMFEMSRSLVYPPDGAREGNPWGPLPDGFGGQWYEEQHRLVSNFGEGWIYYTFTTQ